MNEFQTISIDQIEESQSNPRRRFSDKKMQELEESIRKHGVLTPLLVRPIDSHYEILAGARRFRAAKACDLAELPVRIKQMGDAEALEIQILENIQREDIHPLEEAFGYKNLLNRLAYDIPAIAAKVAKSEAYIYQRLKLLDLIEPAQRKFLEDEITAGHAILIARLQPKDQKAALENCFERYGMEGNKPALIGVRQLALWIDQNIHLDLHSAPFSKADPDLTSAGPCVTCAKRTGFVPQLFPDVAKKDTCTDPACFKSKLQVHIKNKEKESEAEGEKLLRISCEYPQYGIKRKSSDSIKSDKWRQVLKKNRCEHATKAIVVEGGRDIGQILEVCADPACKTHFGRQSYRRDPQDLAREKAGKEKRKKQHSIRAAILQACLNKIESPLSREDLEQIATAFWADLWTDYRKGIIERRGWQKEKQKGGYGVNYELVLGKYLPALKDDELAGFLIELSVASCVNGGPYERKGDRLLDLAKRYGVNPKAIEKRVLSEFSEKKARGMKKAKAEGKGPKQKEAKPDEPAGN